MVKEIFSGVFEKVFSEPFMSSPWRSRDIFSSKKDQIFKACVKAVAGKGCWNAIFEIAKVCASEMSVQTIRKIRKFYLQDEYMLIKIAEICARRAGKTMAKNLRSFGIQSQAAQDRIFQMCTEKKQLQ